MPSETELERVAIRATRVLDPASGEVFRDGVVVVQGSRIEAVSDAPPAGVFAIDLGERTLLPGLIDAHTHMLLRPEDQVFPPAITFKSQAYRAVEGVAAARTALNLGITAVRDTDNEGAWLADIALRDAINNGVVPGPRMQVASTALSITAGDMTLPPGTSREANLPDMAAMVDSRDAMIAEVRRQVKMGTDWIKLYVTSTRRDVDRKTFEPVNQFSEEDVRAVVNEAKRWRRDVIAHAYGSDGARAAIRGGARTLEHGPLLEEADIQLLVEHGTYFVPTMATYYKRQHTDFDREFVRRHRVVFTKALAMGVKIAFGTDVGSFPHGEQVDELSLMVAYGMPPLEAIRAATTVAAELMRLDGQIGAIAPGCSADLIAVEGDPLTDIECLKAVRFVIKEGKVFRDDCGVASAVPEVRWRPSRGDL